MNLLFLNNYHYLRGGSERVYFGEMDLLTSQGHEVRAFARKTPMDLPSELSEFFPKGMETERLNFGFGTFRTLKEVLYSSEAKKRLAQALDRFTPDIAHAHNIYGRLTTSVLDLLNSYGIPAVMTLHDYKLVCPSYKFIAGGKVCEACQGKYFYHAVLNRCHKNSLPASCIYAFESWFNRFFDKYGANINYFIAPSQFLKDKLIGFGWPEDQVVYIPNFVVSQEFQPNYEFEDYFLYIGRLSGEKGISTLIRAFKKLTNETISLVIAGEGPERQHLQKMAVDNNRIKFTGYLSGKGLSDLIRSAKGVVVPSEWYENAPLSILEAFAYGKPVIGARIGGIPELIDDGINGLIFEPADIDDLLEKMESFVAKSNSTIGDMGKAAREKVEKQFSAEAHYRQLMDLYNKALSQ